jgi:hypothetical protein
LSHRATLLQRNGALPARESCELLVLDRSVDPVAPVIHEWTYEALVYDLLSLDDNIIRWVPLTVLCLAVLCRVVLCCRFAVLSYAALCIMCIGTSLCSTGSQPSIGQNQKAVNVLCCAAPLRVTLCRYKAETAAGASEVKDHVLDDATDDLWAELRHAHIAGVEIVCWDRV